MALRKWNLARVRTSSLWMKNGLSARYRQVSWARRVLPDCIVIGAMKSGTSSLFSYLSQHPQLCPPCAQEVHFFDGGLEPSVDTFEKGQSWYRAHFPIRTRLRRDRRAFEVSPLYLFNPLVPGRMFDLVPKVKLIALLRDPVERAISHYFHERSKGRESLGVFAAMQEEEGRLAPVMRRREYKSRSFIDYSYKSRGRYREQVERYLKYFPWSQILLVKSEDLFDKPNETLGRVFEFMGVDDRVEIRDLRPRNVSAARHEVDSEVYEYLAEYFRPHNQALDELVGTYPAECTADWKDISLATDALSG